MAAQPERSEGSFRLRMIRMDAAPSSANRWLVAGLAVFLLGGAVLGLLLGPLTARVWLPTVVPASGWLEPEVSRAVRAPFEGRLSGVLVAPGQPVTEGETVAMMDDRELQDQILELDDELRMLRLGEESAAQDRRLERATLALERGAAEMDLADARDNLLRRSFEFLARTVDIDSLLDHHRPGSHIGVDAAVNEVRRVHGRLDHLSARERWIEDGVDGLQAAARMTQLEHRRQGLQARRAACLLRAPIDGVVQTADLDQLIDRRVTAGEAILEVAVPDAWRVRLLVGASGIHRVHVGDTVRVRVEALSQILAAPLAGLVEQVGVRPAARESGDEGFFVLAALLPPDDTSAAGGLRGGFLVRADILTGPATLGEMLRTWWRRKLAAVR